MRARLLLSHGEMILLLKNGRIIKTTKESAFNFIKNYDSSEYAAEDGKWLYETSMIDYEGETIAIVDDAGKLIIEDPKHFRFILEMPPVNYLTINEYAEKHDKARGIVARFCRDGRLAGVIHKGNVWLIPENAPYPADGRAGKRIIT